MLKKLISISLFSLLSIGALSGCSVVPAGNVGIKVYLYGGNKGVDHEVLGTGRYWIGFNEELYLFPVFQQNYPFTKSQEEGNAKDESITFQTREGMTINTDVGISYSLDPNKVADIFQKYRKGVDEITHIVLRNSVRDNVNKLGSDLSVEEAYATKKREFLEKVTLAVKTEFEPIGIKIDKIYLIGEMRIPKEVTDALNSKIKATQDAQRMQNEVATARAQAEKTIVAAEADARAIALKKAQLSRELIEYEAVQKWNGVLPTYTGGAVPFINLNPSKEK